ncbi:MAG: T9SS type A sorting domain-containing protein [Flavobacteriales bacterium]|nr:T9SS type A sorting domain-containing protein [Flavobacteriales bacterium]
MKKTLPIVGLALLLLPCALPALSQPFSKRYIMSYHSCPSNCQGFQQHNVQLAESDNGVDWTEVPGFQPYSGSVPDVIMRGQKLYVFTPGKVKRFSEANGQWDSAPQQVSMVDGDGSPINFVDPSAFVDDEGRLVLFFLNSTGTPMGQDPAGCGTYPCTKYFDSAVEVDGSDGTQFVLEPGHRLEFLVEQGPGGESDPDVFHDGTDFILYVSKGTNTYAYRSTTLHGTYLPVAGLQNNVLTTQGGVPCGHYDPTSGQYWTYAHRQENGTPVIRLAQHDDLSTEVSNFSIVVSASIMGYSDGVLTESPGLCENLWLVTSSGERTATAIPRFNPNPASSHIWISGSEGGEFTLLDLLGRTVLRSRLSEDGPADVSTVRPGMYMAVLRNRTGSHHARTVIER